MAVQVGHTGRIKIDNVNLSAHRWSVDYRRDEFDVTVTENSGVGMYTTGIKDADISFDAYVDDSEDPFNSATFNIAPGTVVTLDIEYVKNAVTYFWSFPYVLILTVRNETSVRDVIHYSVTAKATEFDFTVPTGT